MSQDSTCSSFSTSSSSSSSSRSIPEKVLWTKESLLQAESNNSLRELAAEAVLKASDSHARSVVDWTRMVGGIPVIQYQSDGTRGSFWSYNLLPCKQSQEFHSEIIFVGGFSEHSSRVAQVVVLVLVEGRITKDSEQGRKK